MKICSECQRCYDDVVEQCSEWHGQLSKARKGSVSMIAGYRIEERLYSGLRGDLFRATRIDCGQSCLIRIITADEERAKDFLKDARVVADLYHPNLTAVFESGTTDNGEVFVVSEDPTEAETLRDLLDKSQQLDLVESIHIVRVIAETLHELHKSGVVFRALSPENVLVAKLGDVETNVRLQNTDLGGVAQHAIMSNRFLIDTETAAIRYFSPEQCAGESATARSDVYSLGVLLYELIAGVPPFDADRAAGVIEQHKHARPPEIKINNFDLRMLISHTLMESLSKRSELRQSSADLFARQLRHIEQLATHVSTPAPVVKTVTSAPKPSPRLINLAESGLDLTDPGEPNVETVSLSAVGPQSEFVAETLRDHSVEPAGRSTSVYLEAAETGMNDRSIDPDSIRQIDFRAARERMKDLLGTSPATPVAPKLIRLDEPLDDVPSIDDTLEVLRSEGGLTSEFHATTDNQKEIVQSTDELHLIGSGLRESELPVSTVGLIGLPLDEAESARVRRLISSAPDSDDEMFASIESFSAVRFVRLRRGIAIGAAVGLIALAFTFRADILETFTPFDLGKLEPPPYRPAASSIVTSAPQPTNIIYAPPTQFEPAEPVTELAEERPTAVMITGNGQSREERPAIRKVSARASEPKPADPIPSRQKPEQYKPETLVITYPDPKTKKRNSDRDPFVKPRPGPGMTRPRIVANPKP